MDLSVKREQKDAENGIIKSFIIYNNCQIFRAVTLGWTDWNGNGAYI